jgi:hypothetical protein
MMAKQISLAVVAVAIMIGMSKLQPHNEEALLSDWSTPPPWPIFIAVNVLAGALRAAADALTPPPFKILDISASQSVEIQSTRLHSRTLVLKAFRSQKKIKEHYRHRGC